MANFDIPIDMDNGTDPLSKTLRHCRDHIEATGSTLDDLAVAGSQGARILRLTVSGSELPQEVKDHLGIQG